jgi:hypothetical protein
MARFSLFIITLALSLAACRQASAPVEESPLNSVAQAPTLTPTATRPAPALSSSGGLFGAGANLQPTVTPLPTQLPTATALAALVPFPPEVERINSYGAQTPPGWSRYVDPDGLLLTDGFSFVVVRAWAGTTPGINDWAGYFPNGRPEAASNFRAGIAGREWRGLFVSDMAEGQPAGQALYAVSDSGLATLTIIAYVPRNLLVDFDAAWRTVNAVLHSLALE